MLAITFGFTLLGDRNVRVNGGGGPNLTLRGILRDVEVEEA
jgi:hypothetical protein